MLTFNQIKLKQKPTLCINNYEYEGGEELQYIFLEKSFFFTVKWKQFALNHKCLCLHKDI